jgi:hypothetical protein
VSKIEQSGRWEKHNISTRLVLTEGDDMTSAGSEVSDSDPQPVKSGNPQLELNERLVNAVNELYQLLELYAPAWYPEELRRKAEATLLAVGKTNAPISRPQSKPRICRSFRDCPRRSAR